MAFAKLKDERIPRLWLLVGESGSGKTLFAIQMQQPMVVVDSDHRFAEYQHLFDGDLVFRVSENPGDNVSVKAIAEALDENMPKSEIKTILVDTLTPILRPIIDKIMQDTEDARVAGEKRNAASAFNSKARTMSMLRTALSKWGVDVLVSYHVYEARDAAAKQIERETVSALEVARLQAMMNARLKIVRSGKKYGIEVVWSRWRYGMTIWDDVGNWQGMPELIEQAMYGGLSRAQMAELSSKQPTTFADEAAAVAWAVSQGCYKADVHAQNAMKKIKTTTGVSGDELWPLWIDETIRRTADKKLFDSHTNKFAGPEDAKFWAVEQKAFANIDTASTAYIEFKRAISPDSPGEMWYRWMKHVDQLPKIVPASSPEPIRELAAAVGAEVAEVTTSPVFVEVIGEDDGAEEAPVAAGVYTPPAYPITDKLTATFGETLDQESLVIMQDWLIRKFTTGLTPNNIRSDEDGLTGDEIAKLLAAIDKNKDAYLKAFVKRQQALAVPA